MPSRSPSRCIPLLQGVKTVLLTPRPWVCLFLLVTVGLLSSPLQKVFALAAIQGAVQRDWEISFGYSNGVEKPRALPSRLDSAAHDIFERALGNTRYDGSEPAKTRNRNIVYHERFRAFFRGSIQDVHIYDFEAFHGNLGTALARLPELRRFSASALGGDGRPTEAEWTRLCTHLRTLP